MLVKWLARGWLLLLVIGFVSILITIIGWKGSLLLLGIIPVMFITILAIHYAE